MHRKIALLVLLFSFLTLPAAAQSVPGLTGIGVKGGLSFATLRGDFEPDDFGYDTGFTGGLYGQATFLPYITPRIEALYVQKGAVTDAFPGLEGTDVSYELSYIEIPVLVKFNLPLLNRIFPSVYAGPYYSFAIGREIDAQTDGDEGDNLGDPEDDFDANDYGLVFGTDVDFTFAGTALTLSGRYDLGLANIANEDNFDDDVDLKTGTFIVTLGFSI